MPTPAMSSKGSKTTYSTDRAEDSPQRSTRRSKRPDHRPRQRRRRGQRAKARHGRGDAHVHRNRGLEHVRSRIDTQADEIGSAGDVARRPRRLHAVLVDRARGHQVVHRRRVDHALRGHGGLDALDESVSDPSGIRACGGDGEGFGGLSGDGVGDVLDRFAVGLVFDTLTRSRTDGCEVAQRGYGIGVAAPEDGGVSHGDLSLGVAVLALGVGTDHAGVVVVGTGLHAAFEADAETARGVGVRFAVIGGLTGKDVA